MFDRIFRVGPLARSESVNSELQTRLRKFYTNYAAPYFEGIEGDMYFFYNLIKPDLLRLLNERGKILALDLGAGRTNFPSWLETVGVRDKVFVTAQDVTDANLEHLNRHCDRSFVGDVREMQSEFDFIVSTFAYEHLVFPQKTLTHCLDMLTPGGILYIVSPCYTLLGYLPPALRHLPRWKQFGLNLFLVASSALVRVLGRPLFWIVTDPAVFHLPFRRDYDAIHMVSKSDLDSFMRGHCQSLPIMLPKATGQGRVWLRFMMLIVAYCKR